MKRSHGTWLRVLSLIMPGLILVAGCSTTQPDTESTTSSAPITQSQPPSASSLPDTLQESLNEQLVSIMELYEVPGAAVLVATPDGTWSTEQGVIDLESGDPIESGMAWPLRSVTKSVVVTVLLQLVDEGEVSLEDTIDQYVDGVPNGGEITVHQLANMTSGGRGLHSIGIIPSRVDG